MHHKGHERQNRKNLNGLIRASVVFLVVTAFAPVPADAELVFFSTGRSLSVKSHRTEGASLVLALRGGGEMVCDASAVARIEPDEVPYPEDTSPVLDAVLPPVGGDAAESGRPLRPTAQLQSDPRYNPIIERASAVHGVDATLVRAVIQVESNYQHRARSAKGAKGLMQLMPATARRYGVANLYDPASNIEAGIKHLKSLLDRFPLRLDLALAAYNAGEVAVQRFGGVPPYAETRSYVHRILRLVGRA